MISIKNNRTISTTHSSSKYTLPEEIIQLIQIGQLCDISNAEEPCPSFLFLDAGKAYRLFVDAAKKHNRSAKTNLKKSHRFVVTPFPNHQEDVTYETNELRYMLSYLSLADERQTNVPA